MGSRIEWTEETWNPIVGCSKISSGCQNCYAEKMATRLKGMGVGQYADVVEQGKWTGKLMFVPSHLEKPRRTKKPTVFFLGSMTDVFHELVHDNWLNQIWDIMRECRLHRFLALTKRPERMLEWLSWPQSDMRHLGLGVTVEKPSHYNRIACLQGTPAATRFLSLEPLLGPVNLQGKLEGIDWVIAGGESGPGARPCHPDWIRSARDACANSGTAFFFKQWGAWMPFESAPSFSSYLNYCTWVSRVRTKADDVCVDLRGKVLRHGEDWSNATYPIRLLRKAGKKLAGRLLDGVEYLERPAFLTDKDG